MIRRIYQSRRVRNFLSVRKSLQVGSVADSKEGEVRLLADVPAKKHKFNEYVSSLMEIRPDLPEGYIRSILMDGDSYLARYPDVGVAGLDPVNHFFTFGFLENRDLIQPRSVKKPVAFNNSSNTTVYFSSAGLNDGSFKYRCVYQALCDGDYIVYNVDTPLDILVRGIFSCNELIFSRPEDTVLSRYVIRLAQNLGVKITLDYDDLLLAEFSQFLGHVRSGGSRYDVATINTLKKNAYLPFADKYICSTPLIAQMLKPLNRPIEIRKNRLPIDYLSKMSSIERRLASLNQRRLKVLYLSGTATHKRDFSVITGVLLKLLQKYSDKFEITFLGNTGINVSPFSMHSQNIRVIPRVSFEGMLKVISEHDLGIVPLERTIFNDGKSNIKYIECASQGVPVIATDALEFASAIRHCKNGWLCPDDRSWLEVLENILDSPDSIIEPSRNAFLDVKDNFVIGRA